MKVKLDSIVLSRMASETLTYTTWSHAEEMLSSWLGGDGKVKCVVRWRGRESLEWDIPLRKRYQGQTRFNLLGHVRGHYRNMAGYTPGCDWSSESQRERARDALATLDFGDVDDALACADAEHALANHYASVSLEAIRARDDAEHRVNDAKKATPNDTERLAILYMLDLVKDERGDGARECARIVRNYLKRRE